MKKATKQRKAILSVLNNTTSHPTAEWIYQQAKKEIPTIGLATIYRNLKSLEQLDLIQIIITSDNKEHYDGNTSPHAHLYCTECNKVEDIFLTPKQLGDIADIQESNLFQLLYYGLCKTCKNK